MRTFILLAIDHRKPIPELANMIAGRAYTIDGVTDAVELKQEELTPEQLQAQGFSLEELALGFGREVERS